MVNTFCKVITLCTLTPLIMLLILHFRKHFSIQFCGIFRCKSCIIPHQEDVYFMPMVFALYILYEIILCITIICRATIFIGNAYFIIDQIIIYSLILLPICESLFNFYRFYSTYYATKSLHLLSNKKIIIKFMYCVIPFMAIFLLQMHVYYYLYPIIVAYHFIFNLFCIWLFAHIMIVQYRVVMGDSGYLTDIHDDMLESVYFMRKISIIASINSSIFIGLILVHQSTIMLYMPILWNISTICLALNFVHNRHFFKQHYLTCYKTYLNCQISCNCPKVIRKSPQNISDGNKYDPKGKSKLQNINSNTPILVDNQPAPNSKPSQPPLTMTDHISDTISIILEDESDTPKPGEPALVLSLHHGTSTPMSTDRDPSISSNSKPKWYHRGIVSIGTPKTPNTPNSRLLNNQTMSESPIQLDNRDRNGSNSNKARKVLGIPIYNPNCNVLAPPHTPIPGFLDHLYTQICTVPISLPVVSKFGDSELIKVSSHSNLTMRPIAVNINNNQLNNIKFSKYITEEKKNIEIDLKENEDVKKKKKKDNNKNSLSLGRILKRIGKTNENIINNNFANYANDIDRQTAKSLDTGKSNKIKNKNKNHKQTHSVNVSGLNNISNTPKTPDIHVLKSFKLLAKHGLYSDANIASAEQLRNYTIKQSNNDKL
eukprot:485875_1